MLCGQQATSLRAVATWSRFQKAKEGLRVFWLPTGEAGEVSRSPTNAGNMDGSMNFRHRLRRFGRPRREEKSAGIGAALHPRILSHKDAAVPVTGTLSYQCVVARGREKRSCAVSGVAREVYLLVGWPRLPGLEEAWRGRLEERLQ